MTTNKHEGNAQVAWHIPNDRLAEEIPKLFTVQRPTPTKSVRVTASMPRRPVERMYAMRIPRELSENGIVTPRHVAVIEVFRRITVLFRLVIHRFHQPSRRAGRIPTQEGGPKVRRIHDLPPCQLCGCVKDMAMACIPSVPISQC
jgi:hypothetical protein